MQLVAKLYCDILIIGIWLSKQGPDDAANFEQQKGRLRARRVEEPKRRYQEPKAEHVRRNGRKLPRRMVGTRGAVCSHQLSLSLWRRLTARSASTRTKVVRVAALVGALL